MNEREPVAYLVVEADADVQAMARIDDALYDDTAPYPVRLTLTSDGATRVGSDMLGDRQRGTVRVYALTLVRLLGDGP